MLGVGMHDERSKEANKMKLVSWHAAGTLRHVRGRGVTGGAGVSCARTWRAPQHAVRGHTCPAAPLLRLLTAF